MGLRRGREIVLMQWGVKCGRVLQPPMRLKGCLLAGAVNFEHELSIPFIICEGCWHAFGDPDSFPVNIALLSHIVHIIGNEDVVAFNVHLILPEEKEVVGHADCAHDAEELDVEVVGFGGFNLQLSFHPGQE